MPIELRLESCSRPVERIVNFRQPETSPRGSDLLHDRNSKGVVVAVGKGGVIRGATTHLPDPLDVASMSIGRDALEARHCARVITDERERNRAMVAGPAAVGVMGIVIGHRKHAVELRTIESAADATPVTVADTSCWKASSEPTYDANWPVGALIRFQTWKAQCGGSAGFHNHMVPTLQYVPFDHDDGWNSTITARHLPSWYYNRERPFCLKPIGPRTLRAWSVMMRPCGLPVVILRTMFALCGHKPKAPTRSRRSRGPRSAHQLSPKLGDRKALRGRRAELEPVLGGLAESACTGPGAWTRGGVGLTVNSVGCPGQPPAKRPAPTITGSCRTRRGSSTTRTVGSADSPPASPPTPPGGRTP